MTDFMASRLGLPLHSALLMFSITRFTRKRASSVVNFI